LISEAVALQPPEKAMSTSQTIPARLSASPASPGPFDAEYDVIVVGGGGGGLPAALFARWLGNSVVLLEKAAELGGTARKAAFWYWVPNNKKMRELGRPDEKVDFLRDVARLSRPENYDPENPRFGSSEWEYAMCEAIYESASPAAELLSERGALPYRHCAEVPDYWAELPEDKAPRGCAALTNEGDFVYIASAVGAQLRNMNYAWMCPVSLEKAVAGTPDLSGMFSVAGDSMLWVDKRGYRVVNEKLAYNELAQIFFQWDAAKAEYPYLVLIAVWDQRSQEYSASGEYGRLIVPAGTDDSHVIRGETWELLEREIAKRLQRYSVVTGGLELSVDFLKSLKASVTRFNQFAKAGRDDDFHRGERQVEQLFNGAVKEEPGRTNLTMYPLSDHGPYYAALVSGGTLDTKGGPKTTINGQVLDDLDRPIPGLYGVGNCVASASGRAYWAGGATLGPILAFAYRAAQAAHAEPVKQIDAIAELVAAHSQSIQV
jgi:FAD binding domain/FAD dependent oxidoreductase